MTWLTATEYLCHKLPRVCSVCCNYNKSGTTGATCGARTTYPLYCLTFFGLRLLLTLLVSSNFSFNLRRNMVNYTMTDIHAEVLDSRFIKTRKTEEILLLDISSAKSNLPKKELLLDTTPFLVTIVNAFLKKQSIHVVINICYKRKQSI